MEQAPVRARSDLIDDVRFEIDVKRPGDMLARRRFGEERAETIVVGRGGILSKTTVGLPKHVNARNCGRRVDTHAETVLNGVELPCNIVRSSALFP